MAEQNISRRVALIVSPRIQEPKRFGFELFSAFQHSSEGISSSNQYKHQRRTDFEPHLHELFAWEMGHEF